MSTAHNKKLGNRAPVEKNLHEVSLIDQFKFRKLGNTTEMHRQMHEQHCNQGSDTKHICMPEPLTGKAAVWYRSKV
jgi:hypothetical protein